MCRIDIADLEWRCYLPTVMRGTTPLGQVELVFNKRGGRRKGAGRKRRGRKRVSHASRPDFPSRFPTHITLRFIDGLPSMRRRKAFKVASCRDLQAFLAAGAKQGRGLLVWIN
jgi:hypothetical protein